MNLLTNLLGRPAAEAFGWTLVHSLWQFALIAVAAAAVLLMMRRARASTRYAVALCGLALMALTPLATFFMVLPREVPQSLITAPHLTMISDVTSPITPEAPQTLAPAPLPLNIRMLSAIRESLPAAETLYLAGLLLFSLRLALGYARLRSLVRRVHPLTGSAWQSLNDLAARVGVRRAVRLLESSLIEVPTVVGILRPAILLPITGLTGLSPDQLSAILAHELAHIRRHDHLFLHAQTLIETLLFYHPAAWWLSARVRQERENSCDDIAVALTGNPLDYARALESLEHFRAAPRHTPPHLVAAARSGALLPRIRRLLKPPASPARPLSHAATGLLILLALGVVFYAVGCKQGNNPTATAPAASQPAAEVMAEPSTQPSGPQVLMKIMVMNVDADYLDAHAAKVPATPDGTVTTNAAPKELLAALGDKDHCEIVIRPSIVVLDGQRARIQTGQQLPTSPTKPIQYTFVGSQIDATPHIASDGQSVKIDFAYELSCLLPGATTQVDGVPMPIIDRRSGKTALTLADGETAMIIGNNPPGSDPAKPARRVVITVSPHIAMDGHPILPDDIRLRKSDAQPETQPGNTASASPTPDPLSNLAFNSPDDSNPAVFFIAHLKNAKSTDLAAALTALHAPKAAAKSPAGAAPKPDAAFIANTDTNALLVTTDREHEKGVRDQIAALDVAVAAPATTPAGTQPATQPGAKVEYHQLKIANAADVARVLNIMFSPANTTAPKTPRLYADSDARTNTVVFAGPADQVKQGLEMIQKIDAIPPTTAPAAGPATAP